MSWFKNLKRWQRGGIIGCGVGLILVCLIIFSSWKADILFEWIQKLHMLLFVFSYFGVGYLSNYFRFVFVFSLSVVIIACYGGFGALVGVAQQVSNPFKRWVITGLLVFSLLFIYWFNFQVVTWWAGGL